MIVQASPGSVVNSGNGNPWLNPQSAASTGTSFGPAFTIGSFSISDNVATFETTGQQLIAGQEVGLSGFTTGTYFNGKIVTVLSSGLTATTFTADFTYSDVDTTDDNGTGTPAGQAATLLIPQGVSVPDGQSSIWCFPTEGTGTATGETFYQINLPGGSCGNPTNGEGDATFTLSGFQTPTLPEGATLEGIYLVCCGVQPYGSGNSGFLSGGYSPLPKTWGTSVVSNDVSGLIGGLDGIPTVYFTGIVNLTVHVPASAVVCAYAAVQVVYSGGSEASQSLSATEFNISAPTGAVPFGISLTMQAGNVLSEGATLSVQLTVDGTPVGTAKPVTLGTWPDSVTLGSDSDTWGISNLSAEDIESIGVLITPSAPVAGQEIALNELVLYVNFGGKVVVVFVNSGPTRLSS